jgi:hypothetical protein
MKFHLITLILKISLLPQKNPEKMQIVDLAKLVVENIKISMKKEDQEWLENLS